jgi:23S rRNA (adenine2503-C2)-methyltransferase
MTMSEGVELPHLYGLLPEDLTALLRARGVAVREAEARRVLAHVVHHGRAGWPRARPVPRALERALEACTRRDPLELVAREEDETDGFVRYLLRSPDGALSEAVRIPLQRAGACSVCLSSQVGCAMGCDFCATGRLGWQRDLEAWEMVAAFRAVRDDLPADARATGAVFMGQGEPLLNEGPVLQAARVLSDPNGGRLRAEAISVSTVGVTPAIRRYTEAGHRFRLIVSLTSAVPARRALLLPATRRWPLPELVDALAAHARCSSERVTLAWVLLDGVNTGADEIEALARLNAEIPIRLNLIDVNDPRPDGYRRVDDAELDAFRDRLRAIGVPFVRRYSGGASAHAACGMLAARGS